MKRFIYYFILFLFVFVFDSGLVFASSGGGGYHSVSGYSTWSKEEQRDYQLYCLMNNPLIGVYGWECPSDQILANDYPDIYTQGYTSYLDFLIDHSTVNEKTETITYDDEALDFLNYLKSKAENEMTYQYRYMPTSNQLKADSFRTRNAYAILKELISSHPDKMFCVSSARHSYDGKNNLAGLTVRVYDLPYGAVNSFSDLAVVNCTFYTEEWQSIFHMVELYIVDHDANNSCLVYKDSDGVFHEIQSVEEIKTFDLNSSAVFYDGGVTEPLGFSHSSFNSGASAAGNCFSDTTAAIPVFKSVADLKNGTSVGNCAQIMPGYTGQPITDNSITQTEINDFSTNYNNYYGSGSGGSGSGSGSSSGSSGGWLSSLLSGLGNIGDIIMSLLAKAVEIITEILKFFTDTILDAIDIIPTGFVEFLTALFPMIPEEWITCVNLALALMLIGIIVKIFK
ncbi:MAG: hypothetical protein J6K58_14125 [Lachnospiraceae bacterium]|nr:hypothetical protein [Lachnospiraceae bacterium]